MGGRPWAVELERACDSLGFGRRRADCAKASMRGARRKFSKLKTDSMTLGGRFGMADDILEELELVEYLVRVLRCWCYV